MTTESRKLQVKLDYHLPPIDPKQTEKRIEGTELTANYIESAVANVHPQGLDGSLRRTWGRLQRKLDTAIEEKMDDIELSLAECDFLKIVFEKCKIPSAFAKYFIILEIEIEEVTKRI